MSVQKQIEDTLTPLVEAEGMELVDIQYTREAGRKVLRVFLDKEGGITLSDCELMSGRIGDLLDESDMIPDAYVLEVSSPGIDRVLKKEKDFARFACRKARVSLFAPMNGQRNFVGRIASVADGAVDLEIEEGKTVTIPIGSMAMARLEPDIEF